MDHEYRKTFCPIGGNVMIDPVYVNGVDYDRVNIIGYVNTHDGKCQKGKKVNLDDLQHSSRIIKSLCRKALRK